MSEFSLPVLKWLQIILQERFGSDFSIEHYKTGLKLSVKGEQEGYIYFPNLLSAFHLPSLSSPCTEWDVELSGWKSALGKPIPAPCVSSLPDHVIVKEVDHFCIYYDILGLIYWMLNRIEEIGCSCLDSHGRFPAINSHAYKHNYLERPVVDEWLNILGQVIQRQWPQIILKEHEFIIKVSHDVDAPSQYAFCTWGRLFRSMVGDIIKRGDFKRALWAPWIKVNSKRKIHPKDKYNTFDWIMDRSEKAGIKSAFYFICDKTDPLFDSDYDIDHPAILDLMSKIDSRGHEIGLHPSYNTYLDSAQTKFEADRLRNTCASINVDSCNLGGRMHYLRWEQPSTLQAWNDAGMSYDSTLGYADRAGFRCGTCYEYQGFNPITQKILNIRIRPLIVMECTVIAERYMGFGYTPAAKNKFLELKDICNKVGGSFTLLWHNSNFSQEEKRLYEEIIV